MNDQEYTEESVKLPLFGLPEIWPYVMRYQGLELRMILLAMLTSLADAAYPLFNRYALNRFVGERDLSTLGIFVGAYLALLIVQTVINYINVYDCARMEMYMDRDLRNEAFEHLQKVSLSYYNQNSVGYIHARAVNDTGKIGELIAWQLTNVAWYGSYLVFIFAVMLVIDVRLTLYVLFLMPIVVICIVFFQRKLLVLNREVRETNSMITGDINEGITGAKTIKTLAIEGKLFEEYKKDTGLMYRKSVHAMNYSALFTSFVTFMTSAVLAIVLWKGGRLTVMSMMEIGTLSVFMSYALSMLEPIQVLISTIAKTISIQVNVERFKNLMSTEGEVTDSKEVIEKYGDAYHPRKENWEPLQGHVTFEDVSFTYPDGEEEVLSHFDLDVPKGTNIAIVGETGAGKSTLVNLVCRFFEPTGGRVLIDGRDARERSLGWLHDNLGYVLQSPHLFSGSLRENLKYGNPQATDEEILEAIHLVSADFVYEKLGADLDAEIKEGGDNLSTGEKQLLSIARALLADPAILILDEATASIDTVTEAAVQKAIARITKDRTSFVIAHRLSTIVNADWILLVEGGRIIEQGKHADLMKQGGAYQRLFLFDFNAPTC